MDFKDYYATLGVTKSATAKEIKQAFRKLARKYHPDLNPGDKAAEGRFKDINEAHEVIGDPVKRQKYDDLGANWRAYENTPGGPGQPAGGAPHGAGGAGFRTMSPEDMEEMFGDEHPFSDFFTTFFGGATHAHEPAARGAGGRGRGRARRGRDVEHEIDLSLEDAFHGATRRLSLTHDGRARTVDVRIPAGVGDGARVRVAGEGEQGGGGAASGDLFLRVRLAGHAVFERKGHDLYVKVRVPVTTAVLGGEVQVPTIAGKDVRLKIPALTQNAQMFRLKGYGMPSVGKPSDTGDAYARVDVQLPSQLSPDERAHYEALAKLGRSTTDTHSAA